MTKEEIQQALADIGSQMAELSNEIMKLEKSIGAKLTIDVENTMGVTNISISAHLAKLPDHVAEAVDNIVQALDKAVKESKQEPFNVDNELEGILRQRKDDSALN